MSTDLAELTNEHLLDATRAHVDEAMKRARALVDEAARSPASIGVAYALLEQVKDATTTYRNRGGSGLLGLFSLETELNGVAADSRLVAEHDGFDELLAKHPELQTPRPVRRPGK